MKRTTFSRRSRRMAQFDDRPRLMRREVAAAVMAAFILYPVFECLLRLGFSLP